MRRTSKFEALNEAHVGFGQYGVQVESHPPTRTFDEMSGLRISRGVYDWQLSYLVQVFTSLLPSVYIVEYLYIYASGPRRMPLELGDNVETMEWLEFSTHLPL
jgi:hypothetical protein